ncbi:hypothetical protein SAMN04487962_12531 [Marinobacter segnicrescens]|uniref:Uncharacterized protein n=1 Tax=Marinobacter segnicrescens TaxID=430453 RepID=A0A1I0H8B9_9GAMM|nr:hypothetical protein [Marinobacter segnicrescens]SET79963.1 hypothetical protein SAMN04487962_12531 [Marinobacter segnicrescens]
MAFDGSLNLAFTASAPMTQGVLVMPFSAYAPVIKLDTELEKRVTYHLYVTTQNGQVELPIKSFQSRLRLEGTSFVSAVAPAFDGLADLNKGDQVSITQRVEYFSKDATESEIASGKLTQTYLSESSDKNTLQINANQKYQVPGAPKTVEIQQVQYVSNQADGNLLLRIRPTDIQPGDQIFFRGVERRVREIVLIVDDTLSVMEVQCG